MSENFRIGDCVELKHNGGGIKMTIDKLYVERGTPRAICQWYNNDKKQFEQLSVSLEALKKSEGAN